MNGNYQMRTVEYNSPGMASYSNSGPLPGELRDDDIVGRRGFPISLVGSLFGVAALVGATIFGTLWATDTLALRNDGSPGSVPTGARAQAFEEGRKAGFEAGREQGYTAGVAAGKKSAVKKAQVNAQKVGYRKGFKAGRNSGIEEGQRAGYTAGFRDAQSKYEGAIAESARRAAETPKPTPTPTEPPPNAP